MNASDIKIEHVETSKLINYALNAKLHPPEQVEQIAGSIKKFGFLNPIIIDSDFTILAGHGRVMAARKLDMHTVPVIQVGHLSDIEKKAFILVDNKTQMNTGFDMDILKLELQAIQTSGFEIKPLGFSTLEMRELFSLPEEEKKPEEPEEKEEEAEDPEEAPIPPTLEKRVSLGDVWKLGRHTLICGDSSDEELVFKHIEEKEAHSIVTDPPYGLGTIKDIKEYLKAWITESDTSSMVGSGGFMGKEWDKEVPPPSLWKTWITRARPGAHALVFAGTRTQDLMGMSLRMSGLEIRDQIAWIYGSGFPKSTNISKQLDKEAGAEREVIGSKLGLPGYRAGEQIPSTSLKGGLDGTLNNGSAKLDITAPATDAAKQWDGWHTAIKPALEPVSLVRVPISEDTIANNVLKWGTGGLNIDGCRIKAFERPLRIKTGERNDSHWPGGGSESGIASGITSQGRFPANLILDEEASDLLDEQSGYSGGGKFTKSGTRDLDGPSNSMGIFNQKVKYAPDNYGDSGGASRFFYVAKSSRSERGEGNIHSTVKPLTLMRYLVRLITPKEGTVLEPFCGSGTTLLACEKEEMICKAFELDPSYCDIILHRWENMTGLKAEKLS